MLVSSKFLTTKGVVTSNTICQLTKQSPDIPIKSATTCLSLATELKFSLVNALFDFLSN